VESSSSAVKVSVVIPCHNSSAFLPETVQSVLAQTFDNFEIIFVDDGSEDETRSVVERMMGAGSVCRMRLICQPRSGVAAARNRGIEEADGRYILPLDADDMITPAMLDECGYVLDSEPQVSLVYTDRQDFGDVDHIWTAGRYELEHLKYFNQLAYCCMFRKSMWQRIGGYRVNVTGFDDWDFWIASALRGFRAKHVPKPLLMHRRHGGSFMWQILDQYERLLAQIVLNNPEAYSNAEVEMAANFMTAGGSPSFLKVSRFVFLGRYFEGYNSRPAVRL
jgi:glycosyltransferase involved in cell wall biosynthesis